MGRSWAAIQVARMMCVGGFDFDFAGVDVERGCGRAGSMMVIEALGDERRLVSAIL